MHTYYPPITMLLVDTETAYNKALDYLYGFVDYSLKHASELAKAEFDLDRMRLLMAALGDPQDSYPIIHVAGTKGKGSVAALCASALYAAGYQVGLYTSPHLQDFAERIQVNGLPIPHADLPALVEEIKPRVARIPFITTFELTTALGFLYFARKKVNAAVIEVGLGGRLDATNIITPRVSVITLLSYDHMVVLGNTLAAIAGEKAGIIKGGRPVVCAPQKEEAYLVVQKVADERAAPLTLVGRDVFFASGKSSLDGQALEVWKKDGKQVNLTIPLLGIHQVENAAVACATLWTGNQEGLAINNAQIRKGFSNVKWPGRFEVLRREPPLVIDSAHNREAAARLLQALDIYFPGRSVILLFATLEDKDAAGMLTELKPRLEYMVATRPDHPRACELEILVDLAHQNGIPVEGIIPVAGALNRALDLAGDNGLVLSAGSVAFAGEVRTAWEDLLRSR